jgi:uncharacterized RmlC-like cupin family protein
VRLPVSPRSREAARLPYIHLRDGTRHEYGEGLRKSVDNEAGDFIFIEPGVPHEVLNLSVTEPVVAVAARSDASEWEHIY